MVASHTYTGDDSDCCGAPVRWLTDEEGTWQPGEESILICCECGEEIEPAAPVRLAGEGY